MTQPPADDAAATDPSLALGEVWNLLDALPAARASPDMLATTIEMAAVSLPSVSAHSAAGTRAETGSFWSAVTARSGPMVGRGNPPRWSSRLGAAAAVLAALVAGFFAGRATRPAPDRFLLANLPLIERADVLREAGSVDFLEAVANGDYPLPRRLPGSPARNDVQDFDAAIAALAGAGGDEPDDETLAMRRESLARLSEEERRHVQRATEAFERLSRSERRELAALARALADPERGRLVDAARIWHQWVQRCDPADRRDVIEMDAGDRLEWLDRQTRLDARLDFRGLGRQFLERERERDRENRPRPPGFREGPGFRGGPGFRDGPPPERRPPRPPG